MHENWPPVLPRNCPLSLHRDGYQARIAGKTRWVAGKVSVVEAMRAYHRIGAALLAKVKPMPAQKVAPSDRLTFYDALNRWILDRRADAERGSLGGNTFAEYRLCAKRLDEEIGHELVADWGAEKTEALFHRLSAKYSADFATRALGYLMQACRHAFDRDWMTSRVKFGRIAGKLSARPKGRMKWHLYTPDEIRKILAAVVERTKSTSGIIRSAAEQLHCMILMALNGGYGAKELSDLTRDVIDLDGAIIDHPRGKTGAQHTVTLWPETVAALRVVLAQRPDDPLVFRTREGHPWCRRTPKLGKGGKLTGSINHDNVAFRFNELVGEIGLKKPGQSFYKLRHVHASAAEEFGDLHATFVLIGHELSGSKGHYVKVTVERLRKITDQLRERFLAPLLEASPQTP